MGGFLSALGGAGHAAIPYGEQIRSQLESRRHTFADLIGKAAQEESDPQTRTSLLQHQADLLAGKPIGQVAQKFQTTMQKLHQDNQALTNVFGGPPKEPAPVPGSALGVTPGQPIAPITPQRVPSPFEGYIAAHAQDQTPPAAQPATNPIAGPQGPIQASPVTGAVTPQPAPQIPSIAAAQPQPAMAPIPAPQAPIQPVANDPRAMRSAIIQRYHEAYQSATPAMRPMVLSEMNDSLAQLQPFEQTAARKMEYDALTQFPGYENQPESARINDARAAHGFPAVTISPGLLAPKVSRVDAERMSESDKVANGIPPDAKGNYWIYTDTLTKQPSRPAQPAAAMGMQIRSVPHAISVADARTRATQDGMEYVNQEGVPIDLAKLPDSMGLQAMVRGSQMFYVPISPSQRTVTVGNETYGVTPWEIKNIATGGPGVADLGQARVGTTSTPVTIVRDDAGVPHVLGSTTAPVTSGAKVRPPLTGVRPATTPAPSVTAPITGLPPTAPPRAALPNLPSTSGPRPRQAEGVTIGQDATFMKAARPVRALMTQVFGTRDNPSITSMEKFASLADDPAATKRIGTAIRLLQSDENNLAVMTNSDTSGWAAHGGSGMLVPVSVGGDYHSAGTTGTQKLSAEQAQKINDSLRKAMADLKTPAERQAVVASLKAYEEASGLRGLISSSGALASIATIQKTLPVIGVNTFSSQDYNDRLRRLAEDGANGKWGIPANYFGQDIIDRMNEVRTGKTQQGSGIQPIPGTGTAHYKDGGVDFDIPAAEVAGFMKLHPKAVKQ